MSWTSAHGACNGGDTEKMKIRTQRCKPSCKRYEDRQGIYFNTESRIYGQGRQPRQKIAEVSFVNVNDGTVEGVHYLGKNAQTVQFHPEACAGPLDTDSLFDTFMNMMEVSK